MATLITFFTKQDENIRKATRNVINTDMSAARYLVAEFGHWSWPGIRGHDPQYPARRPGAIFGSPARPTSTRSARSVRHRGCSGALAPIRHTFKAYEKRNQDSRA